MKTTISNLTKAALTGTLVLALGAIIALPLRSTADTLKGAAKQIQLSSTAVATASGAAEAVQPMGCPACKDKTVTSSTMAGKGAFQKTASTSQHLCPACKNDIKTVGHGKAATDSTVHTCSSADAAGCAMK